MRFVNILIKPASGMCNMACKYCFYCDEMNKRELKSYGMMSDQTLKNVIRKTLLTTGEAANYAYQGGEPTLCGIEFFERAIYYQKKYNHNQVTIHNVLQTNGYTIDDDWCDFFRKHDFLIGLSIDGTKDIHNAYRLNQKGEETYDRILHAARLMDKHQVKYNILTVVTDKAAKEAKTIYHEYKKQGFLYQQYIACLEPIGEARGAFDYSLKPEEYAQFLIDLFDMWYQDVKQNCHPFIRQFENYIGMLAGYTAEACDQNGVCSIQNVVEADGSVYPCDFYVLDEWKLGNLNESRMDSIHAKRAELSFVEHSLKLDKKCRECPYYKACKGGCQRQREWNPEGGYYKNYYCKAYQLFFKACYERMEELGRLISF